MSLRAEEVVIDPARGFWSVLGLELLVPLGLLRDIVYRAKVEVGIT